MAFMSTLKDLVSARLSSAQTRQYSSSSAGMDGRSDMSIVEGPSNRGPLEELTIVSLS